MRPQAGRAGGMALRKNRPLPTADTGLENDGEMIKGVDPFCVESGSRDWGS